MSDYLSTFFVFVLLADCSLKALADKVAQKWQKYLQFKSEIYLAYVGVFNSCGFLHCQFCLATEDIL